MQETQDRSLGWEDPLEKGMVSGYCQPYKVSWGDSLLFNFLEEFVSN